jgi:hypothetical protein
MFIKIIEKKLKSLARIYSHVYIYKMSVELAELFLSKPDLAASTRAQYTSHYKKIIDALDSEIRLSSPSAIIKAFEQIYNTASSKWSAISVPVIIYQNNNLPLDKLLTYRDLIFQLKAEHLKDRNKSKNDTLPQLKELTKYLQTLIDEDNYRSFTINFLLTTYGVRNEDVDCFITSDKNQLTDITKNYLLVQKTQIQWIRNVYKTAKTYGKKKIVIKNTAFFIAISQLPKEEWLLVDPKGNHVQPSSIGRFIQDRTFNELSEGDIFKILVRDITQKGKNVLSKLKQFSEWRGTDIKTIAESYDLDLE